jgi:hypothetical protein
MSIHISGLLAASRVVSRAPVPNDRPASPRSASALASADGLRQVAGPGELAVVCRGVDQDRLRLEHLFPESHDPACRPVASRRAGLAYVDHAAPEAIRASRRETARVGAGEGVRTREAVAQTGRGGAGQHRALDTADVGEHRPALERGRQALDEIERGARGHRQHHQLGALHGARSAVGELRDRGRAQRLHPVRAGGREAHHARDAREARLPGQRAADGPQADYRERGRPHGFRCRSRE